MTDVTDSGVVTTAKQYIAVIAGLSLFVFALP